MRTSALLALLAAALALPATAEDQRVDLELVLAIDISQSVDPREGLLQRQGYIQALADPRVLRAIQQGPHGRIAVTYFEWAGPGLWRHLVEWRVIDGPETARAVVRRLEQVPIVRGSGTSITGAIEHGVALLAKSGFRGTRRVIDISGDGPNNGGGNVALARDAAVAAGISVNGLPINNDDGTMFTLPDLDVYYRECVVGGPNAFLVVAEGFDSFADAILKKLIQEIADLAPEDGAQLQLAQARRPAFREPAAKYAPACDVGERMRFFDNPTLPPPGGR